MAAVNASHRPDRRARAPVQPSASTCVCANARTRRGDSRISCTASAFDTARCGSEPHGPGVIDLQQAGAGRDRPRRGLELHHESASAGHDVQHVLEPRHGQRARTGRTVTRARRQRLAVASAPCRRAPACRQLRRAQLPPAAARPLALADLPPLRRARPCAGRSNPPEPRPGRSWLLPQPARGRAGGRGRSCYANTQGVRPRTGTRRCLSRRTSVGQRVRRPRVCRPKTPRRAQPLLHTGGCKCHNLFMAAPPTSPCPASLVTHLDVSVHGKRRWMHY